MNEIPSLLNTDNRVLFQNADGNINMGVWFNDPDVTMDDVYLFHNLASHMSNSLNKNEGLIFVDERLNTTSCYVELHRYG